MIEQRLHEPYAVDGPIVDHCSLAAPIASVLANKAAQARRLLALAAIYNGGARTAEDRWRRMRAVRDWVLACNAEGLT